jgi:hypothetical protein
VPGPPPNPNRRRRNATLAMTQLPAGGREGDPPPWPLGPDVGAQTRLDRLDRQIDDAAIEMQGTDRAAKNAERRMLGLQERAEILRAEFDAAAAQESVLWAELWATPQAVAWERLRWTRDVAQYVRWKCRAELGDLEASKEARLLSDRLGLNPLALLRLRWEIAADEVAEQRTTRAKRSTAAARSRRGLKAVDG